MNNKLNNRNIFSIKLFWQSFRQLKIIGLISAAIMLLITGLPIIMKGINITNNIKAVKPVGDASLSTVQDYTSIVYPSSATAVLIIVFAFITPVLALYCWSFLNKRSTSDFYHSLSYKRQCLFFSKFAAITAWQIIIMAVTFLCSFICYHIFKDYFIVDYATNFRIYIAQFLCALLCSAGIALACSITGNIFSNICLTGLILFLPRFILLLANSTINNSYVLASSKHFMPLLDNSYNMLTSQVLYAFEGGIITTYDISDMWLSGIANVYTLVLAIIYIAIACVLFTIRKSETAGKPALSWKLQFAIRCAIGYTISIFGIFVYVQLSKDTNSYGEPAAMYVIIAFLIAAVVVIIYELISSKKLHRVLKAIPSIIAAYVLAIISGFLLNAGINNMTAYRANADNIDYIKLEMRSNYYSSSTRDYFENVIKNLKITDKDTIRLITDVYNNNSENLDSLTNMSYYSRNSVEYTTYEVYFKEGITGKYRKVFLKESDVLKLADLLTKVDEFCKEYKNLPDYDSANVSFSDYILPEKQRDIYNMMLDEINNVSFADYYNLISSSRQGSRISNTAYVNIAFTRNGTPYSATIRITDLTPKTATAYYNAVNEAAASNDNELFNNMKNKLSQMAVGKVTSSDNSDYSMYWYVYTLEPNSGYYISYNNLTDADLLDAILKDVDNPFDRNFDASKPILGIHYYDDYHGNSISYYMQPSGYDKISDYPGYEDESADVPYSRYY